MFVTGAVTYYTGFIAYAKLAIISDGIYEQFSPQRGRRNPID